MKRKFSSGGSSAWSQPIKKRFKALRKPMKKIGRSRPYGPELKALDVKTETMGINGNSAAAGFLLCNAIQEGSGFFNRIGRKINLKSLMVTADIEQSFANTSAVDPQFARMIVLYDAQPNGVAPVLSDVLQDVTQSGAASINVYSSINLNNRDRFRILLDKKFKLPGVGIAGAPFGGAGLQQALAYEMNNGKLCISKYLKLKGIETQYKSTSSPASIADISTGALWVMVVGQDPSAIGSGLQGYTAFVTTRLRYYDV